LWNPQDTAQSKPPLLLVTTVLPPSMADAKPLSHHFPLLMFLSDLPMILQSEDSTQLLELGNLTTLEQSHGKYGENVVSNSDFLPLSPK
jgi:hypothetical protein